MPGLRLKGQDVSIRIINAAVLVASIDSISSFNDEVALELKEDGFLGETVNRFDEILNGYGGDMEYHVHRGDYIYLVKAITDKAERRTPGVQFNVIRSDLFANGDTITFTYTDVHWGGIPTSAGSRGDYVKVKQQFKCSERPYQLEAVA